MNPETQATGYMIATNILGIATGMTIMYLLQKKKTNKK